MRMRSQVCLGLLLAAVSLSSCSSVRPLGQAATALFTAAKVSDLEMVGVKSGPLVPAQAGQVNTELALSVEAEQFLAAAPLGVFLPITRVGETSPWWIFCPAGELQRICEEVPWNAQVKFTGQPLGGGLVLLPSRLTWSER